MKLSTPVTIPSPLSTFSYGSQFFNIGSCFASNLAEKLTYFGFNTLQNPVGVLFHPFAIEQFCKWVDGTPIDTTLFVKDREVWKSYEAHSCIYAADAEKLHTQLQVEVSKTHAFLEKTSTIFITLGTAYTYMHSASRAYVANCQKQPQIQFKKELITLPHLVKSLKTTLTILQSISSASIYLSVSPVRHIKDGIVENNLSKAHLIAAVHEVAVTTPDVHYFPAYEIIMDELRDYRFYNRDLLHPNQLAIDYVWEKCSAVFFDEATRQTMKKVDAYRKLQAHIPLQKDQATQQRHFNNIEATRTKLLKLEPQLIL